MRRDISGWSIALDEAAAAGWKASGAWRGRTIADDARERAARTPDAVCLTEGSRHLTFAEALSASEQVAAGLWSLGVRPGDVVSFQLPNWIEAATLNIAASLIGAVVNPIVPIYREKETAEILADCGARVFVVPQTWRGFDHAGMALRLRRDLPALKHVVVARPDGPAPKGALAFEQLLALGSPRPDWPRQDPDAVKFALYTSGTTGRAKGVLHTHNSLASALIGCMSYWGITGEDVILMPSPVSHVTGYLWGLEAAFCWGTRTLLMDRWDPAEAVRLIDRHGVTMTVSATPFLKDLLDAAQAAGTNLPSLRIFGCGGASVPPDLIRRAHVVLAQARAFRVYGASEALMIGRGFVEADTADLAADTDGRIVDFDVRVIDEEGHPLPDGQEGEIIARGPARFVGYVDAAETHKSIDAEGFFRTGDLGVRTAQDAILITGRRKDLINRGGEKLSAREIEDLLMHHPAILEVAAVAMPHERLGETTCAFVIPRATTPTLDQVVAFLEKAGVARQKFPERLEILPDFPRTPAGKVKKDVLRAMAAKAVRGD
jgi:non-ribosomal peptide synthetase component E (peptide arylation enzyme)